jgi:hypothetical protein
MSNTEALAGQVQPYDSDHTALVHLLWVAKDKGLTLDNFDELASLIMQSHWLRAVRLHAIHAPRTCRP